MTREEIRVRPRQIDALFVRYGRYRPDARSGLERSDIDDVLKQLFGAVESLVVAVLDVHVVRPTLEETAQIAAQTTDAAPVIHALLAIGAPVGDAGWAKEGYPGPAFRPDPATETRDRATAVAIVEGAIAARSGVAEGPELLPAVLVRLAAVRQEFGISFDTVGELIRSIRIERVSLGLGDDGRFGDVGIGVVLQRLRERIKSGRQP